MQIRLATKDEAGEVSNIVSVLDIEKHNFSEDIPEYISKNQVYLAVDGGKIVGAITLVIEEESCEIIHLASKQTRKGVGSAMIKFAEDICRKKGLPKLWCYSLKRYDANGFYHKMGFEEEFLMKRQWYGEDCYFLGKTLEQ